MRDSHARQSIWPSKAILQRFGSASNPYCQLEKTGQYRTAQQALKIQQWIDGVRSEADRKAKELSDKKAQEQLARDREKIAAEAKAASQEEIAEFKRQNTELKRQKVEPEKNADAKTEAEVKRQRADWDNVEAIIRGDSQ